MSTFDYVDIPPDVIRLQSSPTSNPVRPFTKISTPFPSPSPSPNALPTASTTFSPTKSLSTLLLSTSLPTSIPTYATPRKSSTTLLSTRDPLSIQITTVNFSRFIARVGPVFWLQDRVEEVLMWRRGWKVTAVWISAYAFLCYFPRLVLLLPHAILAAIMFSTYPTTSSISAKNPPTPIAPPPSEGSVDWQANLQAIQNLMGASCDAYDLVSLFTPHITHRSTHTSLLLTLTLLSSLFLLPILPLIPLRPLFFILGVSPFIWTHPFTQGWVIPLFKGNPSMNRITTKGGNTLTGLPYVKYTFLKMKMKLWRWIDNDRLDDRHWGAEMREVELWENERWAPGPGPASSSLQVQDDPGDAGEGEGECLDRGSGVGSAGSGTWSKTHLRPSDRAPWTRGRDGWSGVGGEVSSNLTFSLAPGWAFVETEGWRPDAVGSWVCAASKSGDPVCGSDENGWVYTNDVWADPRRAPLESWKASGMTRRRRWVRRVYFDPALVESA